MGHWDMDHRTGERCSQGDSHLLVELVAPEQPSSRTSPHMITLLSHVKLTQINGHAGKRHVALNNAK